MKKIKFITGLFILTILVSCNKQESKIKKRKIEFNNFSIEIPSKWEKINFKGIDSQVYGIIIKNKDTIMIDYGLYSYDFDNVINVSSESTRNKLDSLGFPIKEMNFSKTPNVDKNQGVFHNEYYYYYKIGDNLGKIRVPKKAGKGILGISFRNVKNSENHLTISGRNLNLDHQNQLLKSFQTIKFK